MVHFKVHSKYYYSKLSDTEKKAYDTILATWLNLENKVTLRAPGESIDFQRVFDSLIDDNPELFYIVFNSLSVGHTFGFATVSVTFSMPNHEIEKTKSRIFAKLQEFKSSIKTADVEKEIHDYLAIGVKYASDTKSPSAHNICGPFLEGSAVCEGYARAFKLICDEADIPCIIVTGVATDENRAENHAWNIVRKGRNNYHVDVTWNSCVYPCAKFPLYYNVSDAFMEKDHTWNRAFFPRCAAPGEYESAMIDIDGKKTLGDAIEKMALSKRSSAALRWNSPLDPTTNVMKQIQDVLKERSITSISSVSTSFPPKTNYVLVELRFENRG